LAEFTELVAPDLATVALPATGEANGMSTSAAAKVRSGRVQGAGLSVLPLVTLQNQPFVVLFMVPVRSDVVRAPASVAEPERAAK